MKKEKMPWFKRVFFLCVLLLFFTGIFTVGFFAAELCFRLTGRPGEWLSHVTSGIFGIFLTMVFWRMFSHVFFRLRKERIKPRVHTRMIDDTLEALSKIAQGDFDVFIEVDEQRPYGQLAESVNKMAKELGSMEKLRQDFISNISHEIQSPLTSISGFAELIRKDENSSEAAVYYASIIETESRRLSKLSENIMYLSTLENEDRHEGYTEFRLDRQIKNVMLMLEPHWAEKDIEPDLSLEKVSLHANEDLLNQVWVNILHNAIKFSPEGGVIKVELKTVKDMVVCSISDNGPGIAPEDQVHIFERFYKADKSRDRALGGNGLGLSLVKKIVGMHEGSIHVKSELGKGAEFVVKLPVEKKEG